MYGANRMLLKGLKYYGKGNWKKISKNYVPIRSPSQVTSHAQKYFLQLKNSGVKQGSGSSSKNKENSTSTAKDALMATTQSSQLFLPSSTSQETSMVMNIAPFPLLTFPNGPLVKCQNSIAFPPYLH